MPEDFTYSLSIYDAVADGKVPNAIVLPITGSNLAVGETLEPLALGGIYRMPSAPVSLEAVSTVAADNVSGTGARVLEVFGINEKWSFATTRTNMSGLTAAAIPGQFLRVLSARVVESGTYSDAATFGHTGTITIRQAGGGDVWATIPVLNGSHGAGVTEIAATTIPKGYRGKLISRSFSVEANKTPDVGVFVREGADKIVAPFTPMRVVEYERGIDIDINLPYVAPDGPFVGPADVLVMALVPVGSAIVHASLKIDLEKTQ